MSLVESANYAPVWNIGILSFASAVLNTLSRDVVGLEQPPKQKHIYCFCIYF